MGASRWVTGLPNLPAPKCKGWLPASTHGTPQRQLPNPPRCVAASSRSLPERRCWSCSNPSSCPPLFPAVKEPGHRCHQAGPAPGVTRAPSRPWEGCGGGGRRVWEQGTRGQPVGGSGQQRQGHLFWSRCPRRSHVTAEMGTMQPVGLSASQLSPTCVLSHPAMASHRHSSSHSMLSPAIWLDRITPIPPHARVVPPGTDVTAGPGPAGLIPDQTRDTATAQPWGCRSTG